MSGDTERELGKVVGNLEGLEARLDRIETKLDGHVERQEKRLQKIEQQLSLGRFLLLVAKAIVLTIVFALAFKFGDIKSMWSELK